MKKTLLLYLLLAMCWGVAGCAKEEIDPVAKLSGVWRMDAERNRALWDEFIQTVPENDRERQTRLYNNPIFLVIDMQQGQSFGINIHNYNRLPWETPAAITVTSVNGPAVKIHAVTILSSGYRLEQDYEYVLINENELYTRSFGYQVFNPDGELEASHTPTEAEADKLVYAIRVSSDPHALQSALSSFVGE